jgi:hypothetical protein
MLNIPFIASAARPFFFPFARELILSATMTVLEKSTRERINKSPSLSYMTIITLCTTAENATYFVTH